MRNILLAFAMLFSVAAISPANAVTTRSYISQYNGQTTSAYRLWTNVIPVGKTVNVTYNGQSVAAVVAGTITNPIPGVAVQVSKGVKDLFGWGATYYTATYTWN